MAMTITMPQLGESVTEGTISKWLKQPGDRIERFESIAEVITDKVNAEIPSPAEGVMGELIAAEGAVIAVGEPICTIETADAAGAASPEVAKAAPAAEERTAEAGTARNGQQATATGQGAERAAAAAPAAAAQGAVGAPPSSAPARVGGGAGGEGLHLTPAVRMLAREHGVDLAQIAGSGLGGRITKKDVLEYVQRRDSGQLAPAAPAAAAPALATAAAQAPPAPGSAVPEAGQLDGDTLVPLTPMRRSIAEHMVRSRQTSPHAWVMVEVDMTDVVRLRAARREEFRQRTGVDLTFLPFAARAVCEALRRHPTLNATWTPDGIVLKRDVNLGIAVALDDNLIVPVLRNADRLTLAGLATGLQDLASRARAGKLRLDDIQGGTFTLNNAGALGTVLSQAIINQPQAAILVMDSIVKRPAVMAGDAIAVRSMMNLSLSFDHRLNDGLQAARFVRTVKELLEGIDEQTALL